MIPAPPTVPAQQKPSSTTPAISVDADSDLVIRRLQHRTGSVAGRRRALRGARRNLKHGLRADWQHGGLEHARVRADGGGGVGVEEGVVHVGEGEGGSALELLFGESDGEKAGGELALEGVEVVMSHGHHGLSADGDLHHAERVRGNDGGGWREQRASERVQPRALLLEQRRGRTQARESPSPLVQFAAVALRSFALHKVSHLFAADAPLLAEMGDYREELIQLAC
eukprot:CAMPEP_0196724500 /NCGR_PEP_ID=MMETSP1091-20130531/6319_1 /TAXON_ID=302021 /ORGANISM="Rhodomonas sp., Strain CCMP768" /LENGTH=225 /DNA_ID=CAMNT_0042066623 /DNA_START=37 /DNA_END=714 /DNA_ORIENTATION=-